MEEDVISFFLKLRVWKAWNLTYVGGGRCVLLVASNFKGVITTGEVRDIVGPFFME